MKKILFILMLMPVLVFGATCDLVNDNSTTEKRTLTCDATKGTTTSFKTGSEYEVLKNSVCTIKCTEEVLFSIDPIQKVLAGTSFNYPLYASGIRKCNAVYNYKEYETKISRLVREFHTLTGTAKATKANELTNYYYQKKTCDNFKVNGNEFQNRYTFDGDVDLKIQTSTNKVGVSYVFSEISYDNTVYVDTINCDACNYNELLRKCTKSDNTVVGWSETATLFGKYTMNDVFLEKYTGEVKNMDGENVCNAGDRYFVSFSEISKPIKNDPTDKGYTLTLTGKNLSNVVEKARSLTTIQKQQLQWDINVNCWYQVENMIFPSDVDENSSEYGKTAFQYRLIDLDNPFPGRNPGYNWFGKENIIYSTKNDLSTLKKFVINLDSKFINEIREYNNIYLHL